MDPFAQQVQRIESNDKVREIVEALRLIPIADVNTRNQLNESLEFSHQQNIKYPKRRRKSQNSHSLNQNSRTTI